MAATDLHRTIEAIWRIESARLIAALARRVGDVGTAEDLAQDAFVAALETWPAAGIPERPGAWLMATARRRAIDRFRRHRLHGRKQDDIAVEIEALAERNAPDPDAALDEPLGDDLLRLMFVACHPTLSTESRVALTLRLLGGLTTEEIARAFLAPVATIQQRIVRAKRALSAARIAFDAPPPAERAARLSSVLEVVYLIFNEGYTATAGGDWMRPELCEEALRLGRILVHAAPDHAEAHGLLALMELQAARSAARLGPAGEPVRLLDQDRSRWDRLLITRGLAALERARARGGGGEPYALQAAIAAEHARAATAAATDWAAIAAHYDALARRQPSPIVELNRAVAHGMAYGPAVGLDRLRPLLGDPALARYHLLPAVHGDLLARLGRHDEARRAFERAARLTGNRRERELLLERAADSAARAGGPRSGATSEARRT